MEIDEFKRRFGARVQTLRRQRGMTQEQLAEAIGKSTDTVSNIETGRLGTRVETVVRLSNVLGVPVSEFFSDFVPDQVIDQNYQQAMKQLFRLTAPLSAKDVVKIIALIRIALELRDGQ